MNRSPAQQHDTEPEAAQPVRGGVSQRFRLALPLYLCLLLALALMGVVNQGLLADQVSLLDDKAELQRQVAVARLRASTVAGPEAVARWAEASGMVTVPEAGTARLIAPAPAPTFVIPEPTMELSTVWR